MEIVKDLFRPNPWIYWVDFLAHITLGWCAFAATLCSPLFSIRQLFLYLVTSLALYRAVIFIHELAHLKPNSFLFFRFVWNLLCGLPLLVPSFTYQGVHSDHHKQGIYGTKSDGEYVPFAIQNPVKIVLYLALIFLLPLLFAARFIILGPLSYLHKTLRSLLWERLSSLAIDLSYRRPAPAERDGKNWRLQEAAAFLYGGVAVGLTVAGVLPYQALLLWYLVTCMMFLLNSLRTLAAHAYRNPEERSMSFLEQYLDSVNVPGNLFVTALWAPVGLRYHATHHLFPTMPYHATGEAHRRLVIELSDNSWYLKTVRKSLPDALRRLWKESRSAKKSSS